MRPYLTLCFVSQLQSEQLIALIHQDTADNLPQSMDAETLAALYEAGWQEYDAADFDAALASFQEVLVVAQQQQNSAYMVGALNAIAWIGDHHDQLPTAPDPIAAPPAIASPSEDLADLLGLANYYHTIADWQKSIPLYEQALALANEQQALREMGLCLNGLGLLYLSLRNFDRGQAYTQAAVAIFEETGDPGHLAAATHNLGIAFYSQHQYGQAVLSLSRSQQLRHQLKDALGEAISLDYLGRAFAQQQEFMFALGCYEAALECYGEIADLADVGIAVALLQGQIARICEQTNRSDLAITYYLEALDTFQTQTKFRNVALIQHRLARLHETAGRNAIALHYYSQVWGNVATPDELAAIINQADMAQMADSSIG